MPHAKLVTVIQYYSLDQVYHAITWEVCSNLRVFHHTPGYHTTTTSPGHHHHNDDDDDDDDAAGDDDTNSDGHHTSLPSPLPGGLDDSRTEDMFPADRRHRPSQAVGHTDASRTLSDDDAANISLYKKQKKFIERREAKKSGPGSRYGMFSCEKCYKSFGKRSQHERHMKSHNPIQQCGYCNFKCRNIKQFEAHQLRHMKENPQFECEQCQVKHATPTLLRNHLSKAHGIFQCAHCLEMLTSAEERRQHMLEVHDIKSYPKKSLYVVTEEATDDQEELENMDVENICEICAKPCRSRALLKIHVAQHLNLDPSQLTDDLEPLEKEADPPLDETEDSEEPSVEYTPSRSRKGNSPSNQYINSMNSKLSIQDSSVNLLSLIRPSSENAIYSCGYCNIQMPNPPALFIHAVTQHGFAEYDARRQANEVAVQHRPDFAVYRPVAYIDTFASPHSGPLDISSGTGYSGRSRYVCDTCGLAFRKSLQHKKHMKIHATVKKCPECSFSCKSVPRILQHQGAKHKDMLRCPRLCLAIFHTRRELTEHKESVHGITGTY